MSRPPTPSTSDKLSVSPFISFFSLLFLVLISYSNALNSTHKISFIGRNYFFFSMSLFSLVCLQP